MTSTPFIAHNGQGSEGGTCLDLELLASYVDGRVTPAERTRIEAHLTRCEDCYFIFSETFHEQAAQTTTTADETEPNPAPKRWLRGWQMAAGLAAAAAIVLAVQMFRTTTPPQQDQALVVALNDLQAAAGPYRPFEARLSGTYPYRPPAAAVRSGSASSETPLAVRDAALKVEQASQGRELGPEQRRALAVMYLTLRQAERAADVAAPLPQSTTDASLLNDAAVALLARGRESDAKQAQALLEQVVARDPNRAEGWFNLGLAAEATGDLTRARDAWARYLAIDPSSPWAGEARGHAARLNTPGR
jgi:tetratricopeptide (TPR) repeat protein